MGRSEGALAILFNLETDKKVVLGRVVASYS